MSKKIATRLPELAEWEKAEYDGIKGSPPKWVPKPYRDEFLSARNTLFLAAPTISTIKQFRKKYDAFPVGGINHKRFHR
jgi:hypothetical protein